MTFDRKRAVVRIEDDGPGISDADMEKVLEPFFRVDRGRNVDGGGTGLGLSLTRSIIREHGGDIRLTNLKPAGMRVEVTLPI